jgi:hypothetical protein
MPSPRQFLVVDVGPLKPLIVDCAAQAHMAPSTWVRELLAQAVEAISDIPAPERPSLKRPPRSGNPVKFFARFTPQESATLKAAAKAAGLSQSEYVARLVMNPASAGAVGVPALQILADSNRQLLALGRNLNQIARKFNERPGDISRADLAQVLDAAEMVRTHVEMVASALKELSVNRRTAAHAKT